MKTSDYVSVALLWVAVTILPILVFINVFFDIDTTTTRLLFLVAIVFGIIGFNNLSKR